MSKGIAINRTFNDMEFLISRWSTEYTLFTAIWGEFCSILEDVVVLTGLPFLEEVRTIKLPNDTEEVALDE